MTWTHTLTESFIRGIGKTSAVLFVAGAAAGVYFVATSIFPTRKVTQGVQVDSELNELETEAEHVTIESVESVTESKLKHRTIADIFDTLCRSSYMKNKW